MQTSYNFGNFDPVQKAASGISGALDRVAGRRKANFDDAQKTAREFDMNVALAGVAHQHALERGEQEHVFATQRASQETRNQKALMAHAAKIRQGEFEQIAGIAQPGTRVQTQSAHPQAGTYGTTLTLKKPAKARKAKAPKAPQPAAEPSSTEPTTTTPAAAKPAAAKPAASRTRKAPANTASLVAESTAEAASNVAKTTRAKRTAAK
jgi:hypothetical protein